MEKVFFCKDTGQVMGIRKDNRVLRIPGKKLESIETDKWDLANNFVDTSSENYTFGYKDFSAPEE